LLRSFTLFSFGLQSEQERPQNSNQPNMPKVIIQPKSEWQKDDCLFCKESATKEAVCGAGNVLARIRFCGSAACEKEARTMAERQGTMLAKPV
jgi:hypothetical protein